MRTTISIGNAEASFPILFQLKKSAAIYLINAAGHAICVYSDSKNDQIQVGDVILNFCSPASSDAFSPKDLEDKYSELGVVLPVGTQITLTQS